MLLALLVLQVRFAPEPKPPFLIGALLIGLAVLSAIPSGAAQSLNSASPAKAANLADPAAPDAPAAPVAPEAPIAPAAESPPPPAVQIGGGGDELFLAARDAARSGDRERLAHYALQLSDHPLAAYVDYWQLLARVKAGEAQSAEVDGFLARHAGSVLADRLRTDWMLALGARGDFAGFSAAARNQTWWRDDPQIRCYATLGLYLQSEHRDLVARDAREQLALAREPGGDGCTALGAALVEGGQLAPWQRIRTLVEQNQSVAARRIAATLPGADAARAAEVIDHAEQWLAANQQRLARMPRDAVLAAISRLAHDQPEQAALYAQRVQPPLSDAERGAVWGRIGHMAAFKLLPDAVGWYRRGGELVGVGAQTGDIARADEVLEWQVRAALRHAPAPDWSMVRSAILRMRAEQRKEPAWIYWLARARAAEGQPEAARELYGTIAGALNFYGRLAAEELGQPLPLPPPPDAASAEAVAGFGVNAGLQRALKLIELGLNLEGIREWNWQMRGLGDRQLLAAAEYARSRGVLDRMIATSERTQFDIDLGQRYPMPLRDQVIAYSGALGLEQAWVYGLMRQESRFSPGALSNTGAQGLMQLMPATARLVARRLGVTDYAPERIAQPDLNLRLGTGYLKLVLDDLDGNKVLATAAYNAGPKRARQWRAALEQPLDGAIFVETIPLAETREYVKKVMTNTALYAALAGDPAVPMKVRLATVAPTAAGSTDLP